MENDEDYLVGKCIIAHPAVKDEPLTNSLIYICSQTEEEVIGFVINKKFDNVSICDIAYQCNVESNKVVNQIEILRGGPEDSTKAFIIHTTDYMTDSSINIDDNIALSSSIEVISDIMFGRGPQKSLVVIGYMSWDPEELEKEIKNNNWWIVDINPEVFFSTDEYPKWEKVMQENLGIDLERFHTRGGMA